MLFKLSMKNFRKSVKDYLIYFFTMILGISVFYIFNAIETQTAMLQVTRTKADIITMMNHILEGVSLLISFILGYLIVYASRFMLKKRKMEFGIYLTLGMSRRAIAGILWMETIWMGIISLAAGLGVGIGLSQFMSLLVSYLFEADVSRFVFVVSGKAILKTIGYFLVIYLVVMLWSTITAGRAKLIDFITADRKKEKNFLKNPVLSSVIFVLACSMLGYAYYQVTAGQENLATEFDVLLQIFLGIAGTFLVFWSLSGLLLPILQKRANFYYKNLNSFVLGEISNKLNSAIISVSVICLLLFLTICILFTVFSRKEEKDRQLEALAPADISMSKEMSDETTILEAMEQQHISKNSFQNLVNVFSYQIEEVTNNAIFGKDLKETSLGSSFGNAEVEIMYVEEYNQVARMYHLPEYALQEQEYLILADMESAIDIYNTALAENQEIQIQGATYHAKETTCQKGFVMMAYSPQNIGILLLSKNADLPEEKQYKNYLIADYTDQGKAFQETMDEEFTDNINPSEAVYAHVYSSTRSNIYDDCLGSSAMYIFLGLYLGICFLLSGSAVLALKILSDAADSKSKYGILEKLGCQEREIHSALRKQNHILFLLPLLLAGIHSIFGIQVCKTMMSMYETKGNLLSFLLTIALISVIYGGYYLMAQICCKKLVKEV